MDTSKRRYRPSLRFTVGGFMIMVMLTVTVIMFSLNYFTNTIIQSHFTEQIMSQLRDTSNKHIDSSFTQARSSLRMARAVILKMQTEQQQLEQFEPMLFSILEDNETVANLFYGDENGNFIMLRREADQSISTKIVIRQGDQLSTIWQKRSQRQGYKDFIASRDDQDRYDPRTRPWYLSWSESTQTNTQPATQMHPHIIDWTDVYIFHSDQKPGITASLPCMSEDGRLMGVVGADISLEQLTSSLQALRLREESVAFIADKKNHQLISIAGVPYQRTKDKTDHINDVNIPELDGLASSPEFKNAMQQGVIQAMSLDIMNPRTGEHDLAAITTGQHNPASMWYIGVITPKRAVYGEISALVKWITIITAIIMILAVGIALVLSHFVNRAMKRLVNQTEAIRRLDLSSNPIDSHFSEVHNVILAFEKMKVGLRGFERYVPGKLVRLALEKEEVPTLGGESRELTIYFSDITNFTTSSEKLPPDHLANYLAEYLTAVTDCIQAEDSGGVVDKYMGDGIMAFWNAPDTIDNHPAKACTAVLKAMEAIRDLEARYPVHPSRLPLSTRFGLHTAEVVVGNFGGTDRLAYTCIGDGVNIAHRLEGLCRGYGVNVLVSESTKQRVGEEFTTRQLDRVTVKGRTEHLVIYELINHKTKVTAEQLQLCELYESALHSYYKQDWEAAMRGFSLCLDMNPEDQPSQLMLSRSKAYKNQPPSKDWDGVFVMRLRQS